MKCIEPAFAQFIEIFDVKTVDNRLFCCFIGVKAFVLERINSVFII